MGRKQSTSLREHTWGKLWVRRMQCVAISTTNDRVAARRRVRIRVRWRRTCFCLDAPRVSSHRSSWSVLQKPARNDRDARRQINQSMTMTSPTSPERRAAARLARSSAARLEFGRSRSPVGAPPRRRPIGGALSRGRRADERRRAAARADAFLGLDARDAPAPPPTHRPHTIKSLATRSSASSLSVSKSA